MWRSLVAQASGCLTVVTSDFELFRDLDDLASLVYQSHVFALSSKAKEVDLFQRKRHLLHLKTLDHKVI